MKMAEQEKDPEQQSIDDSVNSVNSPYVRAACYEDSDSEADDGSDEDYTHACFESQDSKKSVNLSGILNSFNESILGSYIMSEQLRFSGLYPELKDLYRKLAEISLSKANRMSSHSYFSMTHKGDEMLMTYEVDMSTHEYDYTDTEWSYFSMAREEYSRAIDDLLENGAAVIKAKNVKRVMQTLVLNHHGSDGNFDMRTEHIIDECEFRLEFRENKLKLTYASQGNEWAIDYKP
jgi:hypothetical protein